MENVGATLQKVVAEERRQLSARTAASKSNGRFLLAIDLVGVVLIVILAVVLSLEFGRSRRQLQDALSATRATNLSLEAAVAERSQHLITAHEELRRSTAVMESTFHSMAEAVLVIDATGTVVLSNPAAEKMLRYRPGMTVEGLRARGHVLHVDGVTPFSVDELPAARALRGEQFDDLEFVARPKRGNIQVHLVVSGRPLRDANGAIYGAALVYHDITASRETEHKLQQSQKLDAIGKLTGGVAHDFNNMLTVITGTTETLVSALRDQPSLLKTAELIDQAAERCRELIQHLLAFARRQPLEPRNVDINNTVLDVAKLLRPTLGEQIEITSALAEAVAATHVDPSQLANSLLNMAINARDAMPNGGKLLFETSNVVLDEAYAAANPDVRPGAYVMIAVSDTGTGMSKAVQDQVFEPFFTTKEVGKGTGLGLSMVYGFVRQSGGHIKIYSEEGHGTTIKLYLPPARSPGRGEGGGRRAGRRRHRDHSGGGRRSAGAQLRHRAAEEPGLPDRRRRRQPRGACADRQGRAVRPLVHRRHHARRHQRPAARRGGPEEAAGHQGALHLGLYRQRHRASRPPRQGRAASDKTLSQEPARQHRAAGAGRRRQPTRLTTTALPARRPTA